MGDTLTLTRDSHLFGPGPKRVLALDGGGVLGVIEIAYLERMEDILREQHGGDPDFRLSDYFDLIGGTSTGAIIATGLSLGWPVSKVRDLYFEMVPKIFGTQRKRWRDMLKPVFNATSIANLLRYHLGEQTLESPDLKTGLAITAKRLDTSSAWVVLNSPRWKYWEDSVLDDAKTGKKIRTIGNRHFKLRELVRASTAAPYYFSPEEITIAELAGDPLRNMPEVTERGLFVDGGVTPHNTPALLMLMLARMQPYGLNWRLGRDELLVVSLGTGWRRPELSDHSQIERWMPTELFRAFRALRGLSRDCQVETLKIMQWLSEPSRPWRINGEVERQVGDFLLHSDGTGLDHELLSFQRYDVPLTKELDDFVNPDVMQGAYEHAKAATHGPEYGVLPEHFREPFHLSRLRSPLTPGLAERVDTLSSRRARRLKGLTVGITGHRWNRLPQDDIDRIRGQVETVLAEVQADRPADDMLLVSGLAEGSDRIVADMALARGWRLMALLPFSRARYLEDFETAQARAEFERLAAASIGVLETPAGDSQPASGDAYAAQGTALVDASRALITIWDGEDAHGAGGTAEVVALAVAQGKRVFWISTRPGAEIRRL